MKEKATEKAWGFSGSDNLNAFQVLMNDKSSKKQQRQFHKILNWPQNINEYHYQMVWGASYQHIYMLFAAV